MNHHIKKETKQIQTDEIIYFSCEAPSEKEATTALLSFLSNQQKQNEIERPIISWAEIFKGLFLPIFLFFLILFCYIAWHQIFKMVYLMILLLILIVIFFKPFILLSIRLYQKYAPNRIRKSCRFTPTCSDYMILAIKKYGILKGLIKGIKRLSRCHYPNGGNDNP